MYSTKTRSLQPIGFRFVVAMGMVLLSIKVLRGAEAWSFGDVPSHHSKPCCSSEKNLVVHSRRDFVAIATMLSCAGPLLSDTERVYAAEGDPKQRFVEARKELRELINDYSEITANGGGDAVRNRLGTQGVNSKLFGIQKVLKTLTTEAEDIVEFTETMEEFNAYYFQAEGAAYQSMFVEHSSARSTPGSLLKTAKADIEQMEKYMDQLAFQLKL